jgi:hypothetical protein
VRLLVDDLPSTILPTPAALRGSGLKRFFRVPLLGEGVLAIEAAFEAVADEP